MANPIPFHKTKSTGHTNMKLACPYGPNFMPVVLVSEHIPSLGAESLLLPNNVLQNLKGSLSEVTCCGSQLLLNS